jgi:hypothetical protein
MLAIFNVASTVTYGEFGVRSEIFVANWTTGVAGSFV